MKWLKEKLNIFVVVVLGSYIVFLCNMAISYFHAWELFSTIGRFPGVFSHIAVIAFDTVFAISVLIISIGLMKKISLGWQVWVAFLFGLAMTGWSNVRASMGDQWILLVTGQFDQITSTGWESLVSGASTPTSLVAIEFLLAWMVANKDAFIAKISGRQLFSQSPKVDPSHSGDNQMGEGSPKHDLVGESPKNEPTHRPVANSPIIVETIKSPTGIPEETIIYSQDVSSEFVKKESSKPEPSPTNTPEETITHRQDDSPKYSPSPEPDPSPRKNNVIEFANHDSQEAKEPEMLKFARNYFDQHGKHISRQKLADQFGVKPYRARKVLDQLKEMQDQVAQ